MRRSRTTLLTLTTLFMLLGSLAVAQRVTVLTHDSFALPEHLVEEFTASTGIQVVFLPGGDAGEVVNRAILTKARPIADVLYGIDDSLLERARGEDIFEPYSSPSLAGVPEALHLDENVTPVDVGYVIPNIDTAWFEERGLALPATLEDLAAPRYSGLTAVQNPASSSPGLAFMLATIARFGDATAAIEGVANEASAGPASTDQESGARDGATAENVVGDWLEFWAAMRDNDVLVTDGWTDAYYTSFTRYGGDRPVVVSYLTSPAAEVIFAEGPVTEPPTANLECVGCAYRQIEAAGILSGTSNREAAEAFIEFLLSREVQEAIPLAMFVHPVLSDASLPAEFVEFAVLEDGVLAPSLSSETVQANQARWLAQWTAVVVQGRQPADVR